MNRSAALFLQRAGIEAEIYEARASSTDYGGLPLLEHGLQWTQHPQGARARQRVSHLGSPIPRMVIWSGNGKRPGEVRNGARAEVGAPSINILRSRLHQVLREEAERQGSAITFGKELIDLSTNAQGVVATFEDCTTAEGTFLVGCDGVYSRTRPTLHGLDEYGGLRTAFELSSHPTCSNTWSLPCLSLSRPKVLLAPVPRVWERERTVCRGRTASGGGGTIQQGRVLWNRNRRAS